VRFDIPDFEYSPNKQEEINNQKAFLGLYYKNNYDMILDYTGYVDKNNVLKYYTIENALRDYDNLTKEVLFEQRSDYNVYSYLNFILNKRIFKNEIDDEKKQKLINQQLWDGNLAIVSDPRDFSTRLSHAWIMKTQLYPFWRFNFIVLVVEKILAKLKFKISFYK
jgi:hypothetical protein